MDESRATTNEPTPLKKTGRPKGVGNVFGDEIKCGKCGEVKHRSEFYPSFLGERHKNPPCKRCAVKNKVAVKYPRGTSRVFLGYKLREARARRGVSQESLAKAIGISNPDTVRRWENGESEPSATMVLRAAHALGANPFGFLGMRKEAGDA